RGTGILFGDGGGSVVLQRGDGGMLGWYEATDGDEEEILYAGPDTHITMDGPAVFKQAVKAMIRAGEIALERTLENTGVNREEIDLIIPHQANKRIIEAAAKRMKYSMDQIVIDLDRHGNTSSGSIPLALKRAREDERIAKGSKLLLVGFGAGMTEAAAVVEV
ncbi:MAG TPA: 3-oxoacyl-[acyl-carrier-protein] synthase III C-terminal domain-containing protein, partial [Candidatus Saccharimonadales bacterium]|nr:3-oxoacyl-[acyl-carrier-protein] synthase III C-terminal domain-containing protein [Candidatus Saccharimonadales bacterium]